MFGLIGAGIGAAAGSFRQASQEAHERDMVKMQYEYNNKMAVENQKRNKEMWDYTNYENQKKHIEEAGLNPALLYGTSGGGGATAGGGTGQGVGLPPMKGGELAQGATGLGLQAGMSLSQIKLNESQAKKNEAEAEKIAGVDTEQTKAGIELAIQQAKSEPARRGLMFAQGRMADATEELQRAKVGEVSWSIKNLEKTLDYTDRQIQSSDLDNEFKRRTMEAEVEKAYESLKNVIADTIEKYSQTAVNKEEAKAIGDRVMQGWKTIAQTGELRGWELEQGAEKIYQDLKIAEMNIEQKEKDRIKDYILGFGNIIAKFGVEAMKMPGKLGKITGFGK